MDLHYPPSGRFLLNLPCNVRFRDHGLFPGPCKDKIYPVLTWGMEIDIRARLLYGYDYCINRVSNSNASVQYILI